MMKTITPGTEIGRHSRAVAVAAHGRKKWRQFLRGNILFDTPRFPTVRRMQNGLPRIRLACRALAAVWSVALGKRADRRGQRAVMPPPRIPAMLFRAASVKRPCQPLVRGSRPSRD